MSDVSIPGVKSKYDTAKLIEQLMQLERKPKVAAEERLKTMQAQHSAWLDINRRFSALRESSRNLFSFQNPFNERLATSSDDSVLTAIATRDAIEETKSFTVKNIATADRFMSEPLLADTKIPAGNYVFTVGDAKVRLAFSGGTYKDFVSALNTKGDGIVRSQIITIKEDTKVLLIEAVKPGKKNKLGFEEAAEAFAISHGFVEKVSTSNLSLEQASFDKPVDRAKVTSSKDMLTVGPGAEAAFKLPASTKSSNLTLEFTVTLSSSNITSSTNSIPTGPNLNSSNYLEYEGFRIQNAPSSVELPKVSAPPPPVHRDDFSPLYLIDGSGKSIPLPQIKEGSKTISINIADYTSSFLGLGIRNNNTDRTVTVQSIKIFDESAGSGFKPKNPVSIASDAIISMDGIDMTRSSNTISDIVPGLTINLHGESDRPVKLKIEPNRPAVKEAIIGLVGNYNRAMAELNIVGRSDEKIIEELAYLTVDEKKAYKEKLGIYKSETTLTQLRSNLQRIMTDMYQTSTASTTLAQFGISTDSRKSGSYDASRLRGYIEIDESTFDKALAENFGMLKEIFARDSDGDLIMDSGVAVKMDTLLKAYTETGGIISIRTKTLDGQITRQKDEITTLDKKLLQKEAELKRKYGLMESALDQMEKSGKALENFSGQK